MKRFSRTEGLIGRESVEKLGRARVAVFGLGGVGGYVTEALARAGVGTLLLIDGDNVDESNINRQIYALSSTVGKPKTEVAAERICDINPSARILTKTLFYTAENADEVDFSGFDYVVDAIDTVKSKLEIIKRAKGLGVPVISAMGAGNKLDTSFRVADISKTNTCPLAKVVRKALRDEGIFAGVKAVFSEENPKNADGLPKSISYVPAVMGLLIAEEVIKTIIGNGADLIGIE